MKPLIIALLAFTFSAHAGATEVEVRDRIDMIELLHVYSERTGVKFVTDPRVKAKVRLIGLELDEIDQITMSQILLIHAYVAYERNGVVYVIPQAVEGYFMENSPDLLGKKWGSK